MLNFVLGFVFDPDQRHVLLLKKRSTDRFHANRWNGVGGHIEPGESPSQAMSRECAEESGLLIPSLCWHPLGTITGDSFRVTVFATIGHPQGCQQLTDEPVASFDRAHATNLDIAGDVRAILLPWLEGGALLPR